MPDQHHGKEKGEPERTPGRRGIPGSCVITTNKPDGHAEEDLGNPVVSLQPSDLRVFGQILDHIHFWFMVLLAEKPTEVAPEEAPLRGVWILDSVGISVMIAVMGCPPQRAFLSTECPPYTHPELPEAVQLVGTVSEVAMHPGCYEEHPGEIEKDQ